MKLRDYQQEVVDEFFSHLHLNPLVMLPTGTGKSFLIAFVVKRLIREGKKVAIFVPSVELVHNLTQHFEPELITQEVAFYFTKSSTKNRHTPFTKAVFLTYGSRKKLKDFAFDIALIDEAHHVRAQEFEKYLFSLRVPVAGFTATPKRLDGQTLSRLFNHVVTRHSYKWFVDNGYLSDYEIFSVPFKGIENLLGKKDDLIRNRSVFSHQLVIEETVKTWIKKAGFKRPLSLYYCVDVNHAINLAEAFRLSGVSAAAITHKMADDERSTILDKFRSGEVKVLTNCKIFKEGVDLPDCLVVGLATYTDSETLFRQMCGRLSRVSMDAPKKTYIDHGGLFLRFGEPKIIDDSKLELRTEDKPRQVNRCKNCGEPIKIVYDAFGIFTCPNCGERTNKKPRKKKKKTPPLVAFNLTPFDLSFKNQKLVSIVLNKTLSPAKKLEAIKSFDVPSNIKYLCFRVLKLSEHRATYLSGYDPDADALTMK